MALGHRDQKANHRTRMLPVPPMGLNIDGQGHLVLGGHPRGFYPRLDGVGWGGRGFLPFHL